MSWNGITAIATYSAGNAQAISVPAGEMLKVRVIRPATGVDGFVTLYDQTGAAIKTITAAAANPDVTVEFATTATSLNYSTSVAFESPGLSIVFDALTTSTPSVDSSGNTTFGGEVSVKDAAGNPHTLMQVVVAGSVASDTARPTTKTTLDVVVPTGQRFAIPASMLNSTDKSRVVKISLGMGLQFRSGAERCVIRLETESGIELMSWGIDNRGVNYPSSVNSCLELSGWIRATTGGTDSALNLQAHSEYRLNGYWISQPGDMLQPISLGYEVYRTGIDGTAEIPLVLSIQWDTAIHLYSCVASGNRFLFGDGSGYVQRTVQKTTSLAATTNGAMRASAVTDGGFGIVLGLADNGAISVATSANGSIARSFDGGRTWRVVYYGSQALNAVTWSQALGLFCAVGATGTILTSPDGGIWTARTSGTTETLQAIAYNATYGFVVGSIAGASHWYSSTDGITWTQNTATVVATAYGVALNGSTIVLGGTAGALYVYNGSTWTTRTAGSGAFRKGCYSSTRSLFLFPTDAGAIYRSSDAVTWTACTEDATAKISQIVDNAGVLLAVGESDYVAWSTDGITFTRLQNTGANSVYGDWVRLEY